MIRTFIAIDLSAEIKRNLERLIQQLDAKGSFPIRWTAVNNIHITLKFLGGVEEKRMPELKTRMEEAVKKFPAFDIRIGELGAFPRVDRARILWVGCSLDPAGYEIQKAVEDVSAELGFPQEDRPFSPHLTIGRVTDAAVPRDYPSMARLVCETPANGLGVQTVHSIRIYRSDLLSNGPKYQALYDLRLEA